MENKDNSSLVTLEQAITLAATDVQAKELISEFAMPFKKLMACYKCAIMEVETKFKVLNENFSIGNDSNHIESIRTRLKSPESIIEKMVRESRQHSGSPSVPADQIQMAVISLMEFVFP